jgi:hypothetical protein
MTKTRRKKGFYASVLENPNGLFRVLDHDNNRTALLADGR